LPGLNLPTGSGGAAGMTAAAPIVTPGTVNAGVPAATGATPALPSSAASAVQQISLGLAQAFTTQNAIMITVPPRDLTTTTFSSAIPLDWKRLQATQGKQGDVVLLDGDVVYIPTTPTLVLIAGAVQNQGPIRYQPGMRIADAINQGGGPGKDAVLRSAIVIHANGQTVHVGPKDAVQPGDIIIVPTQYIIQEAHDQSALERILSSLANAALFFRLF
jgi:protein involved in polysaccharide export with SLBB domain